VGSGIVTCVSKDGAQSVRSLKCDAQTRTFKTGNEDFEK
jgi:hypothetical protein